MGGSVTNNMMGFLKYYLNEGFYFILYI
jgi:hypothetical protein